MGEHEENTDGKAAGRATASPTFVAASRTRDDDGAGFRQSVGEQGLDSNCRLPRAADFSRYATVASVSVPIPLES